MGALNQLVGAVRTTMDQFVARHKREIIDDHEIDISIQVPYCADLDVLDLPGLVAAETDTASEKISPSITVPTSRMQLAVAPLAAKMCDAIVGLTWGVSCLQTKRLSREPTATTVISRKITLLSRG